MPPPLQAPRPTEPVNAAEYDVLQAVWYRGPDIDHALLVERITQFTKLITQYRDALKEANEALKKASEEKQAPAALPTSAAEMQRSIMERALAAAVHYGHPEILKL
jgi:hypothetical protein